MPEIKFILINILKNKLLLFISLTAVILLAAFFGLKLYVDNTITQADQAFSTKQYKEASKLYEKVLNRFPLLLSDKKADLYYFLSASYFYFDPPKSQEVVFKLLKEYPDYPRKRPLVYYNLGLLYVFQEDPYKGGAYFSKFIELRNAEELTPQQNFLLAGTLVDTEKHYQAIPILENLPSKSSEIKEDMYYLYLARAYFGAYYYDKALLTTDKLLNIVKPDSEYAHKGHFIRYLTFISQHDLKNAEKEFPSIRIENLESLKGVDSFEINYYVDRILKLAGKEGVIAKWEEAVSSPKLKTGQKMLLLNALAQYYRNKKEVDKALSFLDEAIKLDPNDIWLYYTYSNILNEQEKHKEASEYDKKALEIDPNHPYLLNGIGWTYYQIGGEEQRAEAAEYFTKALKYNPRFPEAHNNLGLTYFQKAEYDQALPSFQEAVSIDPFYPKPYLNIAGVYVNKKDYGKAIEFYNKALEIYPGYSKAFYGLGELYFDQKNYSLATANFQKSINSDPQYMDSYILLSEVYQEQGLGEKAIAILQQGLKINGQHGGLYMALANIYEDLGKKDQANIFFEKGLSLQKPSSGAAHFNKGKLLKRQEKYEEAAKELSEAIKITPLDINSYILLGQVYQDAGDYQKSIEVLEKASEKDSTNIDVYLNLDYSYRAVKDYQKAITLLNKALEKFSQTESNKKIAEVYDNLGQDYFYQGDLEKALDSYDKSISLDSILSSPHINLGLVYDQKGLPEQAITHYKTGLKLDPENAIGHNNLGYVYARQNNIQEAIKEFNEALRIDPTLKIARENLNRFQGK